MVSVSVLAIKYAHLSYVTDYDFFDLHKSHYTCIVHVDAKEQQQQITNIAPRQTQNDMRRQTSIMSSQLSLLEQQTKERTSKLLISRWYCHLICLFWLCIQFHLFVFNTTTQLLECANDEVWGILTQLFKK